MRLATLVGTLVISLATVLLLGAQLVPSVVPRSSQAPDNYLGFDRNAYPGDAAMAVLRKSFSFTSYWIGPPPGEKKSTWVGKRELLAQQGFGFVVLFSGRESRALKNAGDAQQKGIADAARAVKSAQQEGFETGTIIFLDIEEGGRLPADSHTYLQNWFDGIGQAGYRLGVYCSAIPVNEGKGVSITTGQDIKNHAGSREIIFWVYNDACPPSPGCTFPSTAMSPAQSGFADASIWQYAQSPRRKEFTAQCAATYAADGNCYAPGDTGHKWFLDVNTASSPDPSSAK
jgi:Domain of unknown function (DUF1906)